VNKPFDKGLIDVLYLERPLALCGQLTAELKESAKCNLARVRDRGDPVHAGGEPPLNGLLTMGDDVIAALAIEGCKVE
jgi:hypothetical protein